MKRRKPDNNYAIPISFLRSFICCHSRPFFFLFFFFVARLFVHFSSSFSLFLSTVSTLSLSLVSLSFLLSSVRIVSRKIHGDSLSRTRRDREREREEEKLWNRGERNCKRADTGNDRYRFRTLSSTVRPIRHRAKWKLISNTVLLFRYKNPSTVIYRYRKFETREGYFFFLSLLFSFSFFFEIIRYVWFGNREGWGEIVALLRFWKTFCKPRKFDDTWTRSGQFRLKIRMVLIFRIQTIKILW